jgi:hypothetical protein
MEELNLEKFRPKKAELTALAAESKVLKIKGVDDIEGYQAVDKARIKLMRARTSITKAGKDLREGANAFISKVLEEEKKLIAIVQPVEKELTAKTDAIDYEKEMIKRREKLPERREKIEKLNTLGKVTDALLLAMDDAEFQRFYYDRKDEHDLKVKSEAEEKQRIEEEKIREAQEKIEKERRLIAEQQSAIEAEKEALAEAKAQIEREEEERKANAEIERIRLEAEEARHKELEAAQIEKDKAQAELKKQFEADEELSRRAKMEKNATYMKWLKDNGYESSQKNNFKIEGEAHLDGTRTFTLYKKISQIII